MKNFTTPAQEQIARVKIFLTEVSIMKPIVEGQVMDDAYTVKSEKPLTPGQRVFIVAMDWDADAIFELARFLTKQHHSEDAFQLLREHEEVIRERFVFPYADAIVSTLLVEGRVEEALSFARKIEAQREQDADFVRRERDVAFARVAMYVFRKYRDYKRAKEILREMYDERRRAWGEFLIDWGLALQQLRQTQPSSELQDALQRLIDERGD